MEPEERSIRKLQILAPKIRDHKELETKLTSAPPQLRNLIYETVRPLLTFEAWPLDRYIASAGRMAEREQLPTINSEGKFEEFVPSQDAAIVRKALAFAIAKGTLTLTCARCTKVEQFYAVGEETKVDVVMKARREGWIHDFRAHPAVEICPDCPSSLRTMTVEEVVQGMEN